MENEILKMKSKINQKLLVEKGLDEQNWYLLVQQLYSKILSKYLLSKIDLKEYDNSISNSNLDFHPLPIERRNAYQRNSFLELNYIYVRNFLFIEKLPIEAINYLKNRISNNLIDVDEEMISLVKDTYLDVITDNYRDGKYERDFTSCYGELIPKNIVRGKCLVLVIHYGKNESIVNGKEFIDNMRQKKEFLNKLVLQMKQDIFKKMRIKVEILVKDYIEK